MRSKGGSCIIFCRKVTNISQKKIKEDVSKHQRRACCATLESFRGNEPEIVNKWEISPLFLSFCFGKQALLLMPPLFFQGERDVPCEWLTACPAAGQAGCKGTAVKWSWGAPAVLVFSLTTCSPVA